MNHGQLRCKQVYVAFGLCTSIGKPCNVLSVMHVHMYVRLVWWKATIKGQKILGKKDLPRIFRRNAS